MDMIWAFIKGSRDTILPFITFIAGFLIGLILFGWWLTPVAFNDATPQDLRLVDFQQYYLRSIADQYADGDIDVSELPKALNIQEGQMANAIQTLCTAADRAANGSTDGDGQLILRNDPAAAANLNSVVAALIQGDCNSTQAQDNIALAGNGAAASGSVGSWIRFCLLGLLLLVLAGAGLWAWQQRSAGGVNTDFDIPRQKTTAVPTAPPTMSAGYESSGYNEDGETVGEETNNVVPIASYRTTYELGLDAYDDSFSIENVNGEFLGECGVGISESLGSETPKRVTALEVWLFDKNDIRTITKVAMSDHAFFDEALKAKLAPKGEPILARPDEVIVLETATLIINARITDMIYGDDRQTFFERFAVELSAWAKEDAQTGNTMEFDFE